MIWRLVIIAALGYILYRALKGIFLPDSTRRAEKLRRAKAKKDQDGRLVIEDDMVRDPECGSYVPRREALTYGLGSDKMYFCSPECRDAHVAKMRRKG